jgi:hypothetical protein
MITSAGNREPVKAEPGGSEGREREESSTGPKHASIHRSTNATDPDDFSSSAVLAAAVQIVMRLKKQGLPSPAADIAVARSIRRLAGIVAQRS